MKTPRIGSWWAETERGRAGCGWPLVLKEVTPTRVGLAYSKEDPIAVTPSREDFSLFFGPLTGPQQRILRTLIDKGPQKIHDLGPGAMRTIESLRRKGFVVLSKGVAQFGRK